MRRKWSILIFLFLQKNQQIVIYIYDLTSKWQQYIHEAFMSYVCLFALVYMYVYMCVWVRTYLCAKINILSSLRRLLIVRDSSTYTKPSCICVCAHTCVSIYVCVGACICVCLYMCVFCIIRWVHYDTLFNQPSQKKC